MGNIYTEILVEREFLWIRILAVLAGLSCFISLFYETIAFSCQLSFIQNFIFPFFAASLFLSKKRSISLTERLKIGVFVGASFGMIPATLGTIISNIDYYFLGTQAAAFAARNQPVPPISLSTLYAGIGSQVCIWLLLILLSAFSGSLAALIPMKEGSKY